MLLSEWQNAMHRVGVDWPWALSSDMHAVAEAIYGGAHDETGGDLVPGGLPGHDAVAKLVKKNPGMFQAIAQMRANDRAENVSRNLELSEARAQKILADKEMVYLRSERVGLQGAVAAQVEKVDNLKRELVSVQGQRDRAIQEGLRKQSMLDVYTDLYGESVLAVVMEAATGRRLTADLAGRCENDRPCIDELQRLVV